MAVQPIRLVGDPALRSLDEEGRDGDEGGMPTPGLKLDCRRHQNVVATGMNMHGVAR